MEGRVAKHRLMEPSDRADTASVIPSILNRHTGVAPAGERTIHGNQG